MEALLRSQIIPGIGTENIKLDMPARKVYELLIDLEYDSIDVQAFYPELFVYTILGSISIYINIFNGLVVRIDLFADYQGKTLQDIGIGSTVEYIVAAYSDVAFDESYLLVGKEIEMIINTDWQDDIPDLESISTSVVEKITIEKKGWRQLAEM